MHLIRISGIAMHFDPEEFLPLAEGLDLCREDKIEVIRIVGGIMQSFVDEAFGVHPIQNVINAQQKKHSTKKSVRVDSKDFTCSEAFRAVGDLMPAPREKRKGK